MSAVRRPVAEAAVAAALGVLAAALVARRLWPRPQPSDAELLELLQRRLRPVGVPPESVELVVRQGVVELLGEVDTPELADELVARAGSVRGVVRVESFLTLPEAPVR